MSKKNHNTTQKLLITTVLLLVTYLVNRMSTTGMLGESLVSLREVFPFPFLPPGWVFSVARSAIYIGLGIWVISLRKRRYKNRTIAPKNHRLLKRFWASSLLNILWIGLTAITAYTWSVLVLLLLLRVVRSMLARDSKSPYWGLYTWWIILASMTIGLSQVVYLQINAWWVLSTRWTRWAIAFGVMRASICFITYRNIWQAGITIMALTGILIQILG